MEEEEEEPLDLYVLPEECFLYTLSLTSPRDACRASAVSSIFKSVADSDFVWERFLPSDYKDIISRSVFPLNISSKKELYFFLCDHPILIDGGTKSFALDKLTGKKIYILGARDLSITWGDTPEHWRWRALPESRFTEVAELVKASWLEIVGKIETRMLSPMTVYKAYLVIKFRDVTVGLRHRPAVFSVSFVGSESGSNVLSSGRPVYLCSEDAEYYYFDNELEIERVFPEDREDGWKESEIGEFFNNEGEDGEVKMIVTETTSQYWKRGLIVQGIELRPK